MVHNIELLCPQLNKVQFQDITSCWSSLIIFIHTDLVNIFNFLRNMGAQTAMLRCFYLSDKLFLTQGYEWNIKIAKLKDDAAQTPNICSIVVSFSRNTTWLIQNFRALIKQSSNIFYDSETLKGATSDSKIANLNGIIFSFQKYIAWLQISMYNVLSIQVINRQKNFQYEPLYSRFRHIHSILVFYVDVQIALITILKNDAEHFLILEKQLESANIRMSNVFYDLTFHQL